MRKVEEDDTFDDHERLESIEEITPGSRSSFGKDVENSASPEESMKFGRTMRILQIHRVRKMEDSARRRNEG